MATVFDAFAIAVQHYQAGRLELADQICQQILAADPSHPDTLHLLGLIASRLGRHEVAVDFISRAIALNGTDATYHSNLGSVLKDLGRLDEAAASCRMALQLAPNNAAAHYNLGNALQAQGKLEEAIACFRRVLELKPDYAEAHNNLGTVFLAQQKLEEAAASYRRALEIRPNDAEAHFNLGAALQNEGKLDEAVASYRRALELRPNLTEAHYNLGAALQTQGKPKEAVHAYCRALQLKPNNAESYNNLGAALQALSKLDEAVVCYRRAVELKPDYAPGHYNLGTALQAQGNLDEAVDCFRRALDLKPDYAEAHNNLGKALNDQGKLRESIESYRRALQLKPDNPVTHSNLANAFALFRRFDDARASYSRAQELKPDFPDAHFGQSTLKLLHGDFRRGWAEYEWRWKTNKLPRRDFCEPRWEGSPLHGRTILLHAEQGFGDTIQFVRYAAVVKEQNPAATVIVECQRPLTRLLLTCPGIDRLVAQGDALPPFDVQSPLLSLPGILKTSLETIPAGIPYLFADAALVDRWHERLKPVRGLRVGINWRGRLTTRQRDIPPECFRGLAELPGVRLINLQKGAAAEELAAASGNGLPIVNFEDDFDTAHGAFMDTAAVIMNIDLVISSDTAIPHLAGALGVPVWLALQFVPDWRWLLDRRDSPWYPTMRLFRQTSVDDWSAVFSDIRTELVSMLKPTD